MHREQKDVPIAPITIGIGRSVAIPINRDRKGCERRFKKKSSFPSSSTSGNII